MAHGTDPQRQGQLGGQPVALARTSLQSAILWSLRPAARSAGWHMYRQVTATYARGGSCERLALATSRPMPRAKRSGSGVLPCRYGGPHRAEKPVLPALPERADLGEAG